MKANDTVKLIGVIFTALALTANLLVTITGYSFKTTQANDNTIQTQITGIEKDVADIKASIKSLNECIHGNGHEGLKSDVAVIKAQIKNINTMMELDHQ